MFDVNLHRQIMITILKVVYSDIDIGRNLGFKGGTAAYFFYDLPRFSVDLDFDLLDEEKKDEVFKKIGEKLTGFGEILEATEKYYTLFFLLRYQHDARNIKLEISKRKPVKKYSPKNLLGVPILVGEKEGMLSGKLSAFLTRKVFASRDAFDLWFFLKNGWRVDETDLKLQTGLTTKEAIAKALEKTEKMSNTRLLTGLGELVDEKQKYWVKEKLKNELLFQLKLYQDTHTKT